MLWSVFAVTLAIAAPQISAAQNYEEWLMGATSMRAQNSSEWRVNLGGMVAFAPAFHGGDDSKLYALPLIDVEWRGTVFASTQRGLGMNWIRKRETVAGPRLTIDWGRKPSDDTRLNNTTEIKRSLEAGAFFIHYAGPWRFDGDLRKGVSTGHKGIRASLGAAIGGRLSETSTLILGSSLQYTGAKYNNAYYSVESGGITGLGVYSNILREVSDGGYVGLSVRVDVILGAAKKAVFTEDTQYFAGMVAGVRF
jgi:outer membrane scaffolding protein for murein synthesis (MipA/OmpV family)